MARKPRENHGLYRHPLYPVWQDMIRRCYSPKDQRYPWYGAKGITVCQEWRDSVKAFIEWCLTNGWKPGMEIDKDIKKGVLIYSPATCMVVTHQQNMKIVVGRESGRKTAKLKTSLQDVTDIIAAKSQGITTRELAAKYSVDISTINRIARK